MLYAVWPIVLGKQIQIHTLHNRYNNILLWHVKILTNLENVVNLDWNTHGRCNVHTVMLKLNDRFAMKFCYKCVHDLMVKPEYSLPYSFEREYSEVPVAFTELKVKFK